MWQLFKDFITIDALHIFCFWFIIALAVVGLIDIIYQIIKTIDKINFADNYIKHITKIQDYALSRLENPTSQYGTSGAVNSEDSNEIAESTHFIEVNSDEASKCIGVEHYAFDPIYSLRGMLYNIRWNDRDVVIYCHQIIVDYEQGRNRLQKEKKQNLVIIFLPFTKLYRGLCVLFRLLTFPIKNLFANFDKTGKWEMSTAAIVEIITLVNAIIEFIKHAS